MELELFLSQHEVLLKDLFGAATILGGLITFMLAVKQYARSVKIQRYEKFHEMSVRFDENRAIQKVCEVLNGVNPVRLTRQQKEVFICFLEEISFMVNAGVMEERLAFYTFGYYAGRVDGRFWDEPETLNRDNKYYIHFIEFCEAAKAKANQPKPQEKLTF